MNPRAVRTLSRSAPLLALGAVFFMLSIPAIFDLKSLFVGLAVLCWLLAGATAGFTYFDTRSPDGRA